MKKMTRFILAAGLVLLCQLVSAAAFGQKDPYKDLLGKWDVQTEDGQYTFVWTFVLDKGELTGTSVSNSGEFKMENLKYENGKVTFLVNVSSGGQTMPIQFSAVIEGDALRGGLSLQFGEANIAGKKKK
ncbi:MAG: hypothetical protein NTU60_11760 [Candidatus Aminicenantes bacterium]|nr:hypothetical protein [Candidatus Aminicenantes bacterium]